MTMIFPVCLSLEHHTSTGTGTVLEMVRVVTDGGIFRKCLIRQNGERCVLFGIIATGTRRGRMRIYYMFVSMIVYHTSTGLA